MNLSLHEARIIGCLLEKEITTPDQYPLSLNSLTLACNQKSSREPVMSMTESETQSAIDSLMKKRLVTDQTGFGSRVTKYKHRFCNTEFSDLQFSPAQFALICLLLLRGPQTPGELKSRSGRLHQFADLNEVDNALLALAQKEPVLVHQLPKEPGRRDSRFEELISDQVKGESVPITEHSRSQRETPSKRQDEMDELTLRVSQLELEVKTLKEALQDLLD
ncbi:YceH family protein [Shewanella nanhaiensis]|uniref:YceH family protein n=1 Tax=Shewanella nanhaiensis TaxID=2864872 RepID=A0ABS7E2H1_9GAMM|nr:YceH family protein [Shewanella nanhaiensis]MBW8183894.1 YceH family protein [Shewanella nanhaiensis]